MESGLLCVLPWLTMAAFANIGGWIADTLVRKGLSITVVRKARNHSPVDEILSCMTNCYTNDVLNGMCFFSNNSTVALIQFSHQ